MSVVFRLSRLAKRLALLKAALVAVVGLSSCSSDATDSQPTFQLDPSSVAAIAVAPPIDSGAVGRKVQFSAILRNASGNVIPNRTVSWSTADGAVARVDASGLVTHVGTGHTMVIASAGGKEQRVQVAVTPAAVGMVSLKPAVASVATGMMTHLIATPMSESGDSLTDERVSWSSSQPGIAKVDSSGTVTAIAPGSATITAAADNQSATAQLSVTNVRIATLKITPTSVTIPQGGSASLSVVSRDSANNTLRDRPTTWSSTDSSIASVTPTGTVTGHGPGSAKIIAAAEERRDTVSVAVTAVPVVTVRVSPGSASVTANSSLQLSAELEGSTGDPLTGRTVQWTSSDDGVARVASDGLVTGVAAGQATITATSEAQSGTSTVTVTEPVLVSGGFFAATGGSSSADGSMKHPWDLATALAGGRGHVQPGDTIWVREGTYRGSFLSTVHGSSGSPVVIRQYPGERVIIDGAGTSGSESTIHVRGEWTVLWGLEVTNSDPGRTTSSTSNSVRPNGVVNYASNTRYINLVVHDAGVGFFNDPESENVEVSGCIMYNNGWQAPDRGHGHALYLKTNTGPLTARDNVVFNQFGYGVHAYSSSGGGGLSNIRIEGNVAFNNGTLATNSTSGNILLGGEEYATGGVVRDNVTYFSPTVTSLNVQIGHGSLMNGDVTVRNNLLIGGSPVLKVGYWSSPTFSNNTLALTKKQLVYLNSPTSGFSWSGTRYYNDPLLANWTYNGTSYPWATWKSLSGLGGSDQILGAEPTALRVYVRPNPNERGRGHVIVYNPSGQSSVTVDLSTVLSTGVTYEIRNAQRLFSSPVVSGTYSGGSVVIPLSSVSPPAPVGMSTSPAPTTGSNFGVFVVAVTR